MTTENAATQSDNPGSTTQAGGARGSSALLSETAGETDVPLLRMEEGAGHGAGEAAQQVRVQQRGPLRLAGGELLAEGRVVHEAGRLFVAESELRDGEGRLLAIPDGVAILATIPLGRPYGHHGPVRRRPLRDVVFDARWDRPAEWATDPPGTEFAGGPPKRVKEPE